MPQVARLLPIPRRYAAKGVVRYGFHGLSYAYLLEELSRLGDPAATQGRLVLAHLGNGASLAAVRDGRSIDTSMGFTPTAGLVMSTRTGDLDPGLVYYLARAERMTAARFQQMVNHESGLLGVSETSSDLRDLLAREADDVRAAEAVALFCYQAKKWIGSFAAALGGLDTLVFAGGIGENASLIRERICDGLGFLGIKLDPTTDGAVLPILHLNGYKISNPTILARITHEELEQFLRGCGWTPIFVEGHEPGPMHEAMAAALDTAVEQIKGIQQGARVQGTLTRPRWPMIVLNSPKGWTGPKVVDGVQIEGTFRAHQVPLAVSPAAPPEHLKLLEDWLRSYRPEELFDASGRLKPDLAEFAPEGIRRMGANPHANGGTLLRDLRMPDFREYATDVPSPGVRGIGDTHVLGRFLRDVEKLNAEQRNFRVFGPDETMSNGLEALFDVTQRQWDAAVVPNDEFLAPTGRA